MQNKILFQIIKKKYWIYTNIIFYVNIKRFQSNWNNIINMENDKTAVEESLLARTSREFWCIRAWVYTSLRIGLYYSINDEITESSTLVPTCMEEV